MKKKNKIQEKSKKQFLFKLSTQPKSFKIGENLNKKRKSKQESGDLKEQSGKTK
jgi:hypothetical protein